MPWVPWGTTLKYSLVCTYTWHKGGSGWGVSVSIYMQLAGLTRPIWPAPVHSHIIIFWTWSLFYGKSSSHWSIKIESEILIGRYYYFKESGFWEKGRKQNSVQSPCLFYAFQDRWLEFIFLGKADDLARIILSTNQADLFELVWQQLCRRHCLISGLSAI